MRIRAFWSTSRILLSGLLMLMLSGMAQAQPDMAEIQAQQAELQSLQQSLAEIRETAMAANPEFQQRQQSWQDQFMSIIRDEGIQPRKVLRELQDMERALQEDELSDEARATMREEYMTLRGELADARRMALEDERVSRARESLQADLIAAMTAEDAEVPAMIERFEALRDELMSARQGMQGQ